MQGELIQGAIDYKNYEHTQDLKKHQLVSVIAYVHNDRDEILYFVQNIMEFCRSVFKQCELIFVDDYSTDGSVELIKKYYKENPVDYIVSIIRMGRYHGMEISMNAGRDMSVGDYVYEFDSLYVDYNEKVIVEAHDKCLEGHDIVTVTTNVPLRLTSRLFYKIFNKVSNSHFEIGQETFRLLSRRGINRITSMDVNVPYRKVVYLNSGLSTAQITYKSITGKRPPRITQKYERFNLAMDSFIYFTNIVEKMSITITGLAIFFSIGAFIYIYHCSMSANYEGVNFLPIVLLMAMGFIGLFALIVFIIKYLSVLIKLVFKNQEYLVADVDKIT